MSFIGSQVNNVVKNSGLYTPSEILQLTKDGNWGGSLELIQSQTVSGVSQVDFTSIQEQNYDVHFIEYNIKPSADTQNYIRFSNDSGSSFETSNYQYAWEIQDSAGGTGETRSTSSTQMYLNYGGGNSANEKHTAYYYFYNLGNASKYSLISEQANTQSSTGSLHSFIGGSMYGVAETINAIRLYQQNGTMTGVVELFGVKQI
tara:strand:+ start:958 stop:1566 length:609 start_codon:yes stop_codon:yes gene_type:complete